MFKLPWIFTVILLNEVDEMSRIVILLTQPEKDALKELAESELRTAQSQALFIIIRELERLGLLPRSENKAVERPITSDKIEN
jgi:hypothetical protein